MEYTLAKAAKIIGHKGGAYGLKLDAENADDFPVRLWQSANKRWHGINDITLPVLKAYYENKKAVKA